MDKPKKGCTEAWGAVACCGAPCLCLLSLALLFPLILEVSLVGACFVLFEVVFLLLLLLFSDLANMEASPLMIPIPLPLESINANIGICISYNAFSRTQSSLEKHMMTSFNSSSKTKNLGSSTTFSTSCMYNLSVNISK